MTIIVACYGSKSLDPTKPGLFKNDQHRWSLYLAAPQFFFGNHAPFSLSYRFSLLAEHVQSQWPKKQLPFTLGLAAEGTRYFEMPLFGTRYQELAVCNQNIWCENIEKQTQSISCKTSFLHKKRFRLIISSKFGWRKKLLKKPVRPLFVDQPIALWCFICSSQSTYPSTSTMETPAVVFMIKSNDSNVVQFHHSAPRGILLGSCSQTLEATSIETEHFWQILTWVPQSYLGKNRRMDETVEKMRGSVEGFFRGGESTCCPLLLCRRSRNIFISHHSKTRLICCTIFG